MKSEEAGSSATIPPPSSINTTPTPAVPVSADASKLENPKPITTTAQQDAGAAPPTTAGGDGSRALWIERPGDGGGAAGKPQVFGEDLGSPLPQDGAGGQQQFWGGQSSASESACGGGGVDGSKGKGMQRRLLGGYSKSNLLRTGWRYLLVAAATLFAGLGYLSHYLYAASQTLIEDFLYRMLAFACATVFAAIGFHSYFMVMEIKHPEKIASALCASALALVSMASHMVIGFQGLPLVVNYAGRIVHTVRWVEQVTEVFILISVIEAVNWRMRRSVTSICFQVGAQVLCGAGSVVQKRLVLGLPLQVAGLALYGQIFYLWYDTLQRFRANLRKPRKERDANVSQAWGLVNTFFLSTNAFIAITVLGLLQSYTSVQEAMLYSALDMVTKAIYAAILVRR